MKSYLAQVQPAWHSSFLRKVGRLLVSENSSIVIFGILGLVGILHHEMWRDEMQAWLLAKDSPSLAVLYQNTIYEGHPMLWHVCLYGLARISPNPFVMQVFHLLISIGSFALIAKASPFSWLQKRLFGFSYFIFYEYSVISRSYALGVFLTVLFCTLYKRSEKKQTEKRQTEKRPSAKEQRYLSIYSTYWILVILLVLLANLSVMGLAISFGLGILLLFRIVTDRPLPVAMRSLTAATKPPSRLSLWIWQTRYGLPYALVLIAGWLLCLFQSGRVLLVDPPFEIPQNIFTSITNLQISAVHSSAIRLPASHSPAIRLPAPHSPQLFQNAASSIPTVYKAWQLVKDAINPNLAINKFSQFINAGYFILPPLPLFSIDFWNRHLFSSLDTLSFIDFPKVRFISITVALTGVFSSIKILWKTPRYLWLYVTITGLLTVLHLFVYTGSIRHYGHFLIVLVACLWLSTSSDSDKSSNKILCKISDEIPGKLPDEIPGKLPDKSPRYRRQKKSWLAPRSFGSAFLTILLSIQAFTGIYAYTIDLIYPFSTSRETARYIQSHQLEDEVFFGYDDRKVIGVSGYLDKPFYFPNREIFGSFWKGKNPKLETPQAVASSLDKFAQQQPSFIAITTDPIAAELTAASITELARFDRAIRLDERFYVYRVVAR